MSTYAVIAIKRPNGTVNLARLLQDGDPEMPVQYSVQHIRPPNRSRLFLLLAKFSTLIQPRRNLRPKEVGFRDMSEMRECLSEISI